VARLLVVHHTPSPTLHALVERVLAGARDPEVAAAGPEPVEVVSRAALAATAVDALEADGYILGTPANLGYLSGALKHFFDLVYYPCLDVTAGRPFASYIHGNDDTTGAQAALDRITTGLRWTRVAAPVQVTGEPSKADRDACWELGAVVAAHLAGA
jgi:NAD(P)H-dependent FMN reductase